MTEKYPNTVVRLEPAARALRDLFLRWQCRVRQKAVRHAGGQPNSAMRPKVIVSGDVLGQVTVLIIKQRPEEATAQFRFMVQKTHDPAQRYQSALDLLAAYYYQYPEEFSGQMTALFGMDSHIVKSLVASGRCKLEFEQHNQRYSIPCTVRNLPKSDPAFQATYWHNSLFNPALPGAVQVLSFSPDWAHAQADPPIDKKE